MQLDPGSPSFASAYWGAGEGGGEGESSLQTQQDYLNLFYSRALLLLLLPLDPVPK